MVIVTMMVIMIMMLFMVMIITRVGIFTNRVCDLKKPKIGKVWL